MCRLCDLANDIGFVSTGISWDVSYCVIITTIPMTISASQMIQYLYCYGCPALCSLGTSLPAKLRVLSCHDCVRLEMLPLLPSTLTKLCCSNCPLLSALPDTLPPTLKKLYCNECPNLGPALPALPASLRELDVSDCPRIASIPIHPQHREDLLIDLSNTLVSRVYGHDVLCSGNFVNWFRARHLIGVIGRCWRAYWRRLWQSRLVMYVLCLRHIFPNDIIPRDVIEEIIKRIDHSPKVLKRRMQ